MHRNDRQRTVRPRNATQYVVIDGHLWSLQFIQDKRNGVVYRERYAASCFLDGKQVVKQLGTSITGYKVLSVEPYSAHLGHQLITFPQGDYRYQVFMCTSNRRVFFYCFAFEAKYRLGFNSERGLDNLPLFYVIGEWE